MSYTTDESEHGKLSRNQSGLSLTDDENSGEIMGCGGAVLKKGPWTAAEDSILVEYVKKYGEGNWNAVQKHSGLSRCGKSCRLRWANHLRPNLKKGSFTDDEERLIIELHAKMGNKWARMAAHLPGRTDNEIKNYWNTRIKRRQRSGVPLYPPEVFLQAYVENQSQNTDGFYSEDKSHNGLLQLNSYGLPRDISTDSYCSSMPPTIQGQKRLRNSMDMFSSHDGNSCDSVQQFNHCLDDPFYKLEQSCWLSFSYDPVDPSTKYNFPFGEMQGIHSLNNGNISASEPTLEAVKLELPSLQYPVTDFGCCGTFFLPAPLPESVDSDTDTFLRSPPPMGTMKSEISSPDNSGLLEAVLDESKTLGGAKKPSSNKSSGSSIVTPCDLVDSSALNLSVTEWEDYAESFSALGHSSGTPSIFNDCNPISGGASSLEELIPAEVIPGKTVKLEPADHVWNPYEEKEILTCFSRHDALFGSDCLQHDAVSKRETVMTDPIAMLLGRDCESEYKYLSSETSTLSEDHEWGLGYYAWNNMPAACQMFELP